MSPSSVLTGALSLFLFADKTAEWETPELRETMIKMIAQLAQEAREYVEEVVDGEVSTEELMELLDAPDEASLLVMARCIGMAPTIPGATGGIH
jgi:methionine aminopeptidase